jgi:ribosomal protein L40E
VTYCFKCGTKNSDDSKHCINCGTNLDPLKAEKAKKEWGEDWGKEFGRKVEKWGEEFGNRMEEKGEEFERTVKNDCIGLPHGGEIIGIIIGAFIILFGLSLAMGLDFEVWGSRLGASALIIVGLIIVIGAIYGLTRRR